jgi:predicted small integral membrane protein
MSYGQESLSLFAWMAWTLPVAIFFTVVVALLLTMTVWELYRPTVARKGFLPLVTTRGDRLFIGLLTAAYINLAWAGLTDMTQWIGAGIGCTAIVLVMALG